MSKIQSPLKKKRLAKATANVGLFRTAPYWIWLKTNRNVTGGPAMRHWRRRKIKLRL